MSITLSNTGRVDNITFFYKGKESDKIAAARVTGGEWILCFAFLMRREFSIFRG